jgi:hypothetical protein
LVLAAPLLQAGRFFRALHFFNCLVLALSANTMAGPNYGALGASFMASRAVQAISLITIIGLTANFIQEIVSSDLVPPSVLIGTITVVCGPRSRAAAACISS